MELEFAGEVIEWRGPAPFYYVVIPQAESDEIGAVATAFTYGWGVIPVRAIVAGVSFTTSLFPRHGGYLLPLKDAIRRPAGIGVGDVVAVALSLVPV
ncbi:MAG: DUF1905 domain-containing protein [Propionibacteriaceae bacterium]|nr:DUF1905 domain-containing protein [Propionibacteriaceae bacterium]